MNFRATLAGLLFLSAPVFSDAAVLDARTLDAWNHYLAEAHSRMLERVQSHRPFLWTDETPERRSQVRNGWVLVAPVGTSHPKRVPSGLIHDWIGAAFLPNTTLQDTLAVIKDYSRYKDYYQPLIVDSTPLGGDGREYRFSIVIVNKTLFSRTALHSECGDAYVQVDATRWYSIGSSDNIREIENYGQAGQRELPPGTGSGYLWRIYTLSRYEERDGGVYVEREVIALSRDIPAALRWVVDPIVNRLSRSSLTTSLLQTRGAVAGRQTLAFVSGR